jgi:NTE family protein
MRAQKGKAERLRKVPRAGQIVLVFQGGGARCLPGRRLPGYEAGIEPDWIVGTSIGAINAALIAGNELNRLPKLKEFWDRMAYKEFWHGSSASATFRRCPA